MPPLVLLGALAPSLWTLIPTGTLVSPLVNNSKAIKGIGGAMASRVRIKARGISGLRHQGLVEGGEGLPA